MQNRLTVITESGLRKNMATAIDSLWEALDLVRMALKSDPDLSFSVVTANNTLIASGGPKYARQNT